jgi:hypothetical protein
MYFWMSMSMGKFAYPKCEALVSKGDKISKSCGAILVEASGSEASVPVVPEKKVEQPYVRRFSSVQRLYKLLVSPREAMEDIALAPDFAGVGVIVALQAVFSVFSLFLVFQKIHFIGEYAGAIMGAISLVLTFGVAFNVGLFVVRWLVKALIVKYACDSGSFWSFRTAASVTGYVYIASVLISVVSIPVGWFLVPSFTVDTSSLQAAIQSIGGYQAQINWIILVYSLPVSFVGLAWKSYLGGLGAHFGTEKNCSIGAGVFWFFVIGLLGLLISFLSVIW